MSVIDAANDAPRAGSRQRGRLLLAFLLGTGLVAGAWTEWSCRRYRSAMDEIEAAITARRYSIACHGLENLSSSTPDSSGRLLYLLGSCELARGRNRAADEAWARVVPGCAFAQKALEGRFHLFEEAGLYAGAERLATDSARDPRNDGTALLLLLVPLYRDQGRLEEAERLIENRWDYLNASPSGAIRAAAKLVREHVELTLKPRPVETCRAALERAAQLAPDDDRVWLGRANLALRTGDVAEAERWLDTCRHSRPDDVPVWRACLRLGMTTNRIDLVTQAINHVPANDRNAALRHRASAWLAAHRGDLAAERRELELLLTAHPADMTALARLAELADKENQPDRAAALGRARTEFDRLLARYRTLHDRNQPIRDAEELARLAEALGRPFESRVLLTVAIWEDPDRADLRRRLRQLSPTPAT